MPQRFRPSLAPDERQILCDQGAYTSGRAWKLGELCLTDRRLLFGHMHRQFLEIALQRVEDVRVQKKAFLLASKPCIVLTYSDGARGKPRQAWIVNGHIDKWRSTIARLLAERGLEVREELSTTGEDVVARLPEDSWGRVTAMTDPREAGPAMRMGRRVVAHGRRDYVQAPLSKKSDQDGGERLQAKDIAEIARLVDRSSARMLWHVWKNRYAKLDELKALLAETSHMAVLSRIRQEINPAAQCVLGRPVLVFEQSRIDHETGEHVLHGWWLNEEPVGDVASADEFVDVLDEGDHFLLILELGGAEEDDIRVQTRDGLFSVSVDTAENRYYQETLLPAGADSQELKTTYRNGVLQVRLGKEAM